MAEFDGADAMKCKSAFVYADEYINYRFNEEHPFNQKRVKMTKDLLEKANTLTNSQIIAPRLATDEEICLVHHPEYVDAIKKASKGLLAEEESFTYGIGTEDTPLFPNMHEASSILVGGSLTAVEAVMERKASHALNLGGGLHHGFSKKASGFCIYNDGAIAIKYLREKYNARVLYVDTDAHHGDGVQDAFYDDPNVCTLSIHETGRYLFPGTGNTAERGLKLGYGYSFNFPIDAFTEDDSFLDIYEHALTEIAAYFKPDIIVSQNGADAHCFDPLTHLSSTMKIYEQIPLLAHKIAHEYCQGRWVALGGGGYDIWRVVPRAWAQVWNIMNTGKPIHGNLPSEWVNAWKDESPVPLPSSWEDEKDIYKPIPRQKEINEKNKIMMEKCLQFIRNQQNFHKA